MPGLTIGDLLPNLEVETTHGKMKLHDYVDDSFTIIFNLSSRLIRWIYVGDFTPVCTTELGALAQYADKFAQRGVKLLGLSCDDVLSHKEWIKDIEAFNGGHEMTYPVAADPHREIIKQVYMVDPHEKDSSGRNTPSSALHIVGPDKKIKLSFLYPASTGRNMDEVGRALDSLLTTTKYKNKFATPMNWKPGDKVVISPSVNNDQAKEMFPQGFETATLPSGKDYLRFSEV